MIGSNRVRAIVLTGLLVCLFNPPHNFGLPAYGQDADPYAPYDGIPAGWRLIQGDILVPVDTLQAVFPDEGAYGLTLFWPGGIVPYEFDANVSPRNQTQMLIAMAEWENVANVDFVPRTPQDSTYLHIQNGTVNASNVSMGLGGQLEVIIYNWNVHFIMVHELGHALGFWHEQCRPDCDEYVTINRAHVNLTDDDFEANFGKIPQEFAEVYGSYDFDSLMHYNQFAFSICADPQADPDNCRTITVKLPWNTTWQDAIGQRDHLSKMDALTMSFLYPEFDWVFVNESYELAPQCEPWSQSGTFLSPYCDLTTAAAVVPPGGTIIIQPGYYSAPGVYAAPMVIVAPLGGVTLGK